MTEIAEFFRAAHNDLVYDLETNGFYQEEQDAWIGKIYTSSKDWQVQVDLAWPYPAFPPRVTLRDDKPLSWHQNGDGSLCLYSQSSPGAFPWFAHGALIKKVREWLEHDESGWPTDAPDLDLERYWEPSRRFALIVHDELPDEVDYWIRFTRSDPQVLWQTGFARPPRPRPRSHKHLYGLVVDVGDVEMPPRSWQQLSERLERREVVEAALRDRRADVLLVRYGRDGRRGVLGLIPLFMSPEAEIKFSSVSCASRSSSTMALRAGYQTTDLQEKTVTIVGVGAIGSFVAEGLFRAGVRNLVLVDHDRLRPGNLVRHAASASHIGKTKAEAMARTLGFPAAALSRRVDCLPFAIRLVETADLVIDATANEVVTQLLAEAGRVGSRKIISSYLANQGRSKVVELLPSSSDERLIPQNMPPAAAEGIESGCGDPISPTPPFAVMEVAAMVCRIAATMLIDDNTNARSELREHK